MILNLRAFLTDLASTTPSTSINDFIDFVDSNTEIKQTMATRGMGWLIPAKPEVITPDSLDDMFADEPPLKPRACSVDDTTCESCQ